MFTLLHNHRLYFRIYDVTIANYMKEPRVKAWFAISVEK